MKQAMRSAQCFAFTSRLTSGFSFDEKHYNVVTGFFTPCANSARSGAQQLVRVRDVSLRSGFFSVAEDVNIRNISRPLGYDKNKTLALEKEDFSLNLVDD